LSPSSVVVGDPAPDFTLPGTGGQDYTLSSCRGRPVVLVFYPGDNTLVCTRQLMAYSSDISSFDTLGAVVWGISPQSVESHESFRAGRELKMPLLSDIDKRVGSLYGILGPLGFYRRSIFVVGPDGRVRWLHRSITGATFRPSSELVAAVEDALGSGHPGSVG
jgi:peroxiredoxin Q/BCP